MSLAPAPLPAPTTSFIGRERELSALSRLIEEARLVTLIGAGGSGKTRLALELVARLPPNAAPVVAFVDLAPLTAGELVAVSLLRSLALHEQPDPAPQEVLVVALRGQRALIILDNAEHVIADCAALAERILRDCPTVTLLVTSRARLNLTGEQVYEVEPLKVRQAGAEQSGADAERLFLARARSRLPSFTPSPTQAEAIAALCARLDGLPLAIELAAARVPVLSVQQIADRLAERFQLLSTEQRGVPQRQRTLSATLDWSYELLQERERTVLQRVSVFAGVFTLEAAEAVCADDEIPAEAVLDLLARLIDQSLLQADIDAPWARYRLLETIRLYGRERLREADAVERTLARHAEYFLALAEAGAASSLAHDRVAWLDRLEQHIDDLRQAMLWLLDARESGKALRLAAALLQLCWVRGYMGEGRRWLRAALAHGERAEPRARAAALRAEGQLAYAQGDFAAAERALRESVALFDDLEDEAAVHAPRLMLGAVCWEQGRFDESRAAYEQILASAQRRQDGVRTAEALVHVGLAALGQGDLPVARTAITEALAGYAALDLRQQADIGLGNLGAVAHAEGNLAEARRCYEAALDGLTETGFQLAAAAQLDRLAEVDRREGKLPSAQARIVQSLRLRAELGARAGFAEGLATAGMIAASAGAHERAAPRGCAHGSAPSASASAGPRVRHCPKRPHWRWSSTRRAASARPSRAPR